MDVLLKLSIVMCFGIIGGKVAKLLKLPNVSGYLVFGLLLGPSFINLVTATDTESFSIINELALAIIAFSIGSEFILKEMKKYGKKVIIITLTEVFGAIILVFSIVFFVFRKDFAFSIVIASMSAATAPAATLLVMRQYRAHGPLTKTILPVVALDDVYGIMAFGIAISVALLTVSQTSSPIGLMIFQPLLEIILCLALGVAMGFILVFIVKKLKSNVDLQVISLTAILLATGISNLINISSLLTNIVMGTIVVNFNKRSDKVFGSINDLASPIYLLFFTLAGASLDLRILASVGLLGIAYIIARGGGKMLGAWFGAKFVKAEPSVQKYLGLALLPQGGISIGLAAIVRMQLPQYASEITAIIMFSVLVYEVSGPIFAKLAISKAKEIDGLDRMYEDAEVKIENQPVQV